MRELLHSLTLDVGPGARFEVSRVHPVIHTATGLVAAWRFRLAVQFGEASGFDDLTIELPPRARTRLADWTLTDLRVLLAAAVPVSPRIAELIKIVQFRRDFTVVTDFDLRQLEGTQDHEHLTSP